MPIIHWDNESGARADRFETFDRLQSKTRLKGISYAPKRADGCHGFTHHSFRHIFISHMPRAPNGDAKTVMELSGQQL